MLNYKNENEYLEGVRMALEKYSNFVALDEKSWLFNQGYIDGKQTEIKQQINRDRRNATNYTDSCE